MSRNVWQLPFKHQAIGWQEVNKTLNPIKDQVNIIRFKPHLNYVQPVKHGILIIELHQRHF